MAKRVNVGLDENNKVNGGITLLKPPGGECKLVLGDRIVEESITAEECLVSSAKSSCKVTQPPGGSSKLFTTAKDENNNSKEQKQSKLSSKPYRLKSSFVLGCSQPEDKAIANKKKSVNHITGVVEGEALVTVQSEKFEKCCKVPPGGHTTKLW